MPFCKLRKSLLSVAVLTSVTVVADCAHAVTVFENVGQPLDWGRGLGLTDSASPGAQIGDQVTLDGIERILTSAQIAVVGQVDGTNLQITFRLYAQDGLDNSPGTLLYDSGALARTVQATATLIDFDLPGILAPDTLTWTLQFDGGASSLISILDHDPVSIGSSPDHGWIKPQGQPFSKTLPVFGDGRRFVSRFEAVPEPATQVLLVFGALGIVMLRGNCRRMFSSTKAITPCL